MAEEDVSSAPDIVARELRDATVQTPKPEEGDVFVFAKEEEESRRKRRKSRRRRRSPTTTSEEESTSSGSSTLKEISGKEKSQRRSKSESNRRSTRRSGRIKGRGGGDEDYCRECAHLCDFHRAEANRHRTGKEGERRKRREEEEEVGVQVGGGGRMLKDHYMFDPSLDPMANYAGMREDARWASKSE